MTEFPPDFFRVLPLSALITTELRRGGTERSRGLIIC